MTPPQIIHVDMDAFYASVEQRDQPELRGRPVIVGGSQNRGVVTAASYEARPFGVHSAMPMAEAMRRCPQAVVVPGRMSRYAEVSDDVFDIFERYTPIVQGLSLDEAFMDVTGSMNLFGTAATIAQRIREDIRRELQLTASAGVATSKFVAKIASDLNKPDGLVVVPDDVAGFLAPLKIERMWGIGPVAAEKVHRINCHTIGDLARANPDELEELLGVWGRTVWHLANGRDERPVIRGYAQKSIGAEHTFEHDVISEQLLHRHLLNQAGRVARRLFKKGLYARTVVVKVKHADFTVRSHRTTLAEPVGDTDSIYQVAVELLAEMKVRGRPVRLTGVSVSGLTAGPVQRSLFDDKKRKKGEAIEALTANIRERFGEGSVKRATLLDEDDGEPRSPQAARRR